MATRAKGFQGIVGIKKAVAWGTPVVPGALSGVYVESLETPVDRQLIPNPVLTGRVTMKKSSLGNKSGTVTLKCPLRYEGLELLAALIQGTAGVPSTVDTSARQHDLLLAESIDGLFATLAYELIKDTKVIEIPAVKWNKLMVTAKQGAMVELEFSGIADDYNDASASNTPTTIDTVTITSNENFAVFREVEVLMNAQAGAGLASPGDQVAVEGFTLTIERQMEARVTSRRGDKTDEPIDTGPAQVTGQFEFGFLEGGADGNSGFMADQLAGAEKKAKILITSSQLAGAATAYYQWIFWLPLIQFGPAKPGLPDAGGQKWVQPFEAHHVDTVPTGFTAGFTGACTLQITSKLTTDPLA
jgi:Phage tail tube protein